jgi:hypothetical protein
MFLVDCVFASPARRLSRPRSTSSPTRSAAVKNTLRTTARPKPLIKSQNFAEGLSDQASALDCLPASARHT